MQLVKDEHVQSRFSNTFPRTVEMVCPFCLKEAVFETGTWQEHGRQVAASELTCARCEEEILFVQLLQSDGTRKEGALYCYPKSGGREPMPGVEYLQPLSAPLARSYDSALKLYNRAEWGAAAQARSAGPGRRPGAAAAGCCPVARARRNVWSPVRGRSGDRQGHRRALAGTGRADDHLPGGAAGHDVRSQEPHRHGARAVAAGQQRNRRGLSITPLVTTWGATFGWRFFLAKRVG